MHWIVDQHYLRCLGAPAIPPFDRDALLDRFPGLIAAAAAAIELLPCQGPPHVPAYAATNLYPDIVFLDYGEALDPRVVDRLFAAVPGNGLVRLHLPSAKESVDVDRGTCISRRLGGPSASFALLGEDSYLAHHDRHGSHPAHTFRGRAELTPLFLAGVPADWATVAADLGWTLGNVHFGARVDTPEWALIMAEHRFHVVLDLARCAPILDDAGDATDPDLAERLAAQLTRLAYVPSPEHQPVLFAAFAAGYTDAAARESRLAMRVVQEIRSVFLS